MSRVVQDRQENAERLAMDLSQQLKRVTQEKNALELRNKELEMSLQQASVHSAATTLARVSFLYSQNSMEYCGHNHAHIFTSNL